MTKEIQKQTMKHIFLFILAFTGLTSLAQDQDPKAKPILDDLSKTTKAYKTITSEYVYLAKSAFISLESKFFLDVYLISLIDPS